MTLKELFLSGKESKVYRNLFVTEDCYKTLSLKTIEETDGLFEKIKRCEEFSSLSEFRIMNILPTILIDGEFIAAKTHQIKEDTRFRGRFFMYSIFMIPKATTLHDLWDDDYLPKLLPTNYSPFNFRPRKGIFFSWCPDNPARFTDKEVIKDIKDKLLEDIDAVFENPEKYLPETEYEIMVRGVLVDGENNHTIIEQEEIIL